MFSQSFRSWSGPRTWPNHLVLDRSDFAHEFLVITLVILSQAIETENSWLISPKNLTKSQKLPRGTNFGILICFGWILDASNNRCWRWIRKLVQPLVRPLIRSICLYLRQRVEDLTVIFKCAWIEQMSMQMHSNAGSIAFKSLFMTHKLWLTPSTSWNWTEQVES